MRSECGWLVRCAALLACFGCASDQRRDYGSETHWLEQCKVDADCGGDLDCICGSCTAACDGDATCGPNGACFKLDGPIAATVCGFHASGAAAQQCLPACENHADCGDGRSCVNGGCIVAAAAGSNLAASGGPAGPSDPAAVSESVSFEQPIALTIRREPIDGGDARLIGTWRPTACMEVGGGCASLVIEADSEGNIIGHLHFTDKGNPTDLDRVVDAVDPGRGYPVGYVHGRRRELAMHTDPSVEYRMLDGRFADGRLTFAWSLGDAWHTWCHLQTPFAWHLDDRTEYFCAPQDNASRAQLDADKVSLCTSHSPLSACTDNQGARTLCDCNAGDGYSCDEDVCECNAVLCEVRSEAEHAELSVDGDQMSGVLGIAYAPGGGSPSTLDRVMP